jgi:asparagine synthase (glutamine-hydrolysing)
MTSTGPSSRCIVQGALQMRPESAECALVPRRRHDHWECAAPGVAISWDATSATHAANEHTLCIVWGTPRDDDASGEGIAPRISASDVMQRLVAAGPEALSRIRGAYGLCFVDTRTARAILAVDRFSMQTLCWGLEDGRMCFSDRADAVPLSRRSMDAQALYDFLYFHCIPAPRTVFREVRRLHHGSYLEQFRGELRENVHWKPRFQETDPEPPGRLYSRFRELIGDAVRMEGSVEKETGCFLSGGTDSSTIAGMLSRTAEPARTYSIGFDAPGYDEMGYARLAAEHFKTRHREYYVTADDIVRSVPQIAAFLDQPFGNSSIVPAYFCASMARADGVTRLLAGDGGDELYGGNTRYRFQQFLDAYYTVPAYARESLVEPLFEGPLAHSSLPGIRHARSYVRHAKAPMPDRMESHNLLSRIGASTILDPDWLKAIDERLPLQAQQETYASAPAPDIVNRMLFYDWKYTLADSDLPKVRTAIQLNGMSVGYPFLADEVVDFSLQLPANYKVRRGKLRWFFKQALRDFLPTPIIRKRKHGFGLPFGIWANEHAVLHALAADSLAGLERRGILRKGFRDQLMSNLLPSHPGYHGEMVWILMMLEQWLDAHGRAGTQYTAMLDMNSLTMQPS